MTDNPNIGDTTMTDDAINSTVLQWVTYLTHFNQLDDTFSAEIKMLHTNYLAFGFMLSTSDSELIVKRLSYFAKELIKLGFTKRRKTFNGVKYTMYTHPGVL